MKQYLFLLVLISLISLSSFIPHKNVSAHRFGLTVADSTPTPPKVDSVWIGSGFGWTHGTYHWIPAHWEAAKKKKKSTIPVPVETTSKKDSITTIDSTVAQIINKDSTTTKAPVKDSAATADGRIYIKGHRELQHNNYVWVPGHWVAAPTATK